jgi:hypothetical protein
MHSNQIVDPLNPYYKAKKLLTDKKRNKTEEDDLEISRIQFLAGLYHDDEVGPILPSPNIFRCLMQAGAITRDGKNIERALSFHSLWAPLEYDGPRDKESLWGDGTGKFVDRRVVVVQRASVMATRPIFPQWSATFDLDLDTEILDKDRFEHIARKAGKSIGVGDFRRFYGKFEVTLG